MATTPSLPDSPPAAPPPDIALGAADLPDDPHLGWLRKEAKRVRREHPDQPLAHAQLRVARHYGFASWPVLKRYVELVRSYRRTPDEVPEQDDPAAEFLRLACLTYGQDGPERWRLAAAMLTAAPDLGRATPLQGYVAAACCDVPALRRLLATDPGLATRDGGPLDWAPLAYLAYARHDLAVTADAAIGAVRLLLEHGADPDTGYLWHGLPSPFTVLTGLFGEGEGGPGLQPAHPHGGELARLLLEHGADANDSQTLYNRMFQPDDAHLRLLFEFGLGTGDGGPWRRRLGRAAMGPTEMLVDQLSWAVKHGMNARVELLVAHGVDPGSLVDWHGGGERTAYAAALLSGHASTAALLGRLGAEVNPLAPEERVLAALLGGDEVDDALVPAAIAARPGLVAWAAEHGNTSAVRRAVELGWDIDRRARTDVPSDQEWETGLHAAAGNGDVAMVELLLSLGADRTVADRRFGGTPLQWAEHFEKPDVVALLEGLSADSPSDRSG